MKNAAVKKNNTSKHKNLKLKKYLQPISRNRASLIAIDMNARQTNRNLIDKSQKNPKF